VTGYSSAGADFDPGSGTDIPPNNGGTDAFLSVFDWMEEYADAYTWGGPGNDSGFGVSFLSLTTKQETYVTGAFEGTVDFDPSGGVDSFASNGASDIFITGYLGASYDKTVTIGGTGSDWGTRIIGNFPSFDVCTIGLFSDTVDFDPSAGTDNHTSNGSTDSFLMILTPDLLYE